MGMGILLRSALDPKAVGIFIVVVLIAGICMGPKGTGGSKNDYNSKKNNSSKNNQSIHRNGVQTHDLGWKSSNKMQGHGDERWK